MRHRKSCQSSTHHEWNSARRKPDPVRGSIFWLTTMTSIYEYV